MAVHRPTTNVTVGATKRIKELNPSQLVIAQTAFAGNYDTDFLKNTGFDDIIKKPIRLNRFLKMLNKYLVPAE